MPVSFVFAGRPVLFHPLFALSHVPCTMPAPSPVLVLTPSAPTASTAATVMQLLLCLAAAHAWPGVSVDATALDPKSLHTVFCAECTTAWSECRLGSAPARLLRLLRARLAAPGGSRHLGERLGHWAPSHCLGCSS